MTRRCLSIFHCLKDYSLIYPQGYPWTDLMTSTFCGSTLSDLSATRRAKSGLSKEDQKNDHWKKATRPCSRPVPRRARSRIFYCWTHWNIFYFERDCGWVTVVSLTLHVTFLFSFILLIFLHIQISLPCFPLKSRWLLIGVFAILLWSPVLGDRLKDKILARDCVQGGWRSENDSERPEHMVEVVLLSERSGSTALLQFDRTFFFKSCTTSEKSGSTVSMQNAFLFEKNKFLFECNNFHSSATTFSKLDHFDSEVPPLPSACLLEKQIFI